MEAAWAQGGVGIAALAVIVYIVRELRGLHKETIAFFGNHLSSTVKALAALEAAAERLVDRMDRVERQLDANRRRDG